MDHLWVVIVLLAAGLQTARNAGQKHLGDRMAASSATWVRFGFGLPLAACYLAGVAWWLDRELPAPGPVFLIAATLAAALQITGTGLLILLFRRRNFAVGSTFVRSETLIAAVLGNLVFAETIDAYGWTAIMVSVCGVIMISTVRSGVGALAILTSVLNRSAVLGIASGLCFALSSFAIREASLSMDDPYFVFAAAVTLVTVIAIEAVGLGLFVLATRPADFRLIARHWRPALMVGVTSALGSIGWFTAMTIQKVSYVKALAQIEFLFALLVSILVFRERPDRVELLGMFLTAVGVVILIVFAR